MLGVFAGNMCVSRERRGDKTQEIGGDVMAGQVRVKGVTGEEAKQDCGCGCGGSQCGASRQEVIRIGSSEAVLAKEAKDGRCDCGCE